MDAAYRRLGRGLHASRLRVRDYVFGEHSTSSLYVFSFPCDIQTAAFMSAAFRHGCCISTFWSTPNKSSPLQRLLGQRPLYFLAICFLVSLRFCTVSEDCPCPSAHLHRARSGGDSGNAQPAQLAPLRCCTVAEECPWPSAHLHRERSGGDSGNATCTISKRPHAGTSGAAAAAAAKPKPARTANRSRSTQKR